MLASRFGVHGGEQPRLFLPRNDALPVDFVGATNQWLAGLKGRLKKEAALDCPIEKRSRRLPVSSLN